ncbi:hypothetical protein FRC03_001348 [Tulasnella sp. 419]|nr:hypothetical protein FRC03_001348 [Tulasnella sp. 419]
MNEDEASPSVSEPEVSTKPNPEGHSGQDTPVTSSSASSCPAPPKKSRKSLASLAAASKPKKLTMLEKSKMDWNSHLASASSEERNEIEQSRRGGGYLDKVDFLQRVNERREDARDVLKRRR